MTANSNSHFFQIKPIKSSGSIHINHDYKLRLQSPIKNQKLESRSMPLIPTQPENRPNNYDLRRQESPTSLSHLLVANTSSPLNVGNRLCTTDNSPSNLNTTILHSSDVSGTEIPTLAFQQSVRELKEIYTQDSHQLEFQHNPFENSENTNFMVYDNCQRHGFISLINSGQSVKPLEKVRHLIT